MTNELNALIVDALKQVSGQTFASIAPEQKISSLGLDSVSVMEMVGTLEERIGTQFADEDLAKIETFGDLARLVEQKQKAA